MTTRKADVLSQSDTAFMLHEALGPQRAWVNFLTDCTNGKTNFHGLTLTPPCYLRGRSLRPVYELVDVKLFIEEALKRSPAPSSLRINVFEVELPVVSPLVPPRMRIGERCDGRATP